MTYPLLCGCAIAFYGAICCVARNRSGTSILNICFGDLDNAVRLSQYLLLLKTDIFREIKSPYDSPYFSLISKFYSALVHRCLYETQP